MKRRWRLLLLVVILAAAAVPEYAYARWRADILMCSPGKEIFQLEGHAALRLRQYKDSVRRSPEVDYVVNWGVFDFASPGFVPRFVKGETDYLAMAYPYTLFEREYVVEGRGVTQYHLNLTDDEAERLVALVAENTLPAHRTYRYNYVKDNCATRPISMIERATGAQIVVPDSASGTTTFRKEMQRYHANYPWYQFGIDLALGSGIDYPITAREALFAPVELGRRLPAALLIRPDSMSRLLVDECIPVIEPKHDGGPEDATPWYLTPLFVSIVLFVIALSLSARDLYRGSVSRWFDSLLYGIFFLCGCVVAYLVFISVHEATSPNWVILWLNPFCIIAAVGVWIKSWHRVVNCYQFCNFVALIVLLVGHKLWGQSLNEAFTWLILADLARSGVWLWLSAHHGK